MKALVSLHRGYGLGDAVQMSAVLRHLAKYRLDWRIYYRNEHNVGRGLVHQAFAYGQEPDVHFDFEIQVCLYDTWANWGDRPNTRVSAALHDYFDLGWDPECGRYQVNYGWGWTESVRCLMPEGRLVAIHYQGDSSAPRKNLSHQQADRVCRYVRKLGCCPLLLDWRNKWPLDYPKICRQGLTETWGGDANANCAAIAQCAAFVGIDSGPSKCASATDTPALVTWTGHHPAPFHDPAPNTTHHVPRGYHGLEPVCSDLGVVRFFEQHYNVRQYKDDPVDGICAWLKEVLK